MRPKLIVIDGGDGSGKNTQAKLLVEYFNGLNMTSSLISFPRYEESFFGELSKKLLDSREFSFADVDPRLASLPYALDRWQASTEIKTLLKLGHVVCDRYISASQIHQGGKFSDDKERSEFLSWLYKLEYDIFGIPRPDISIYLDVPVEISLDLMSHKKKDAVEENFIYLKNSYKSAQWLIRNNPEKWIHVKCAPGGQMRSKEDIHKEILVRLDERTPS